MSVCDSDLSAMADEQLASLERYYLTLQGQRALTHNEALRLNAVLMEQHNRAVAVDLCS